MAGIRVVLHLAVQNNWSPAAVLREARAEGIGLYLLAHRLLGPRLRNSPVELVESTPRLVRGSKHVQAR